MATALLALLLVAAFAAEMIFGVNEPAGALSPSTQTLLAFGSLSAGHVLRSDEWLRLFSYPLLHKDLTHLVNNLIALAIVGTKFEEVSGKGWFCLTFFASCLVGGLFSLFLRSGSSITMGASAGILGLCFALLVVSFHFRDQSIRSAIQLRSFIILAIVALSFVLQDGSAADSMAHIGGGVAGIIAGVLLLIIWRRDSITPSWNRLLTIIGVIGILLGTVPIVNAVSNRSISNFAKKLIPDANVPKTEQEGDTQFSELSSRYPDDPRLLLEKTRKLLMKGDFLGAEWTAREALKTEGTWRPMMPDFVSARVHAFLAIAISKHDPVEAKKELNPICKFNFDREFHSYLQSTGRCLTP